MYHRDRSEKYGRYSNQMGGNAPANDVNGVMSIFDYIYQQPVDTDDYPFTFNAFADDFTKNLLLWQRSYQQRA